MYQHYGNKNNHRHSNQSYGNRNNSKLKQLHIRFFLISRNRLGIEAPFELHIYREFRNYAVSIGAQLVFDEEKRFFTMGRSAYQQFYQHLQEYYNSHTEPIVKLHPISGFVFQIQQSLLRDLNQIKVNNSRNKFNIKYSQIQTEINPKSLPFYQRLFNFQKEAVQFGISKHGRFLLADEMGVGKTIQALAVSYIYRNDWPLLIICPPSLKLNWKNEIMNWIPNVLQKDIQLIKSSKNQFRNNIKVMIITYDLASKMRQALSAIKIAIVDEAHYLKGQKSQRSLNLVPFLSQRKRVILLTGTPAFAKPKQIFNLIEIIRPGLFKNFTLFGNRYCGPTVNPFSRGIDYDGCSNSQELHYILKGNIMIRRLKSQVLTELPDKNRQKVILQTEKSVVNQIKQILKNKDNGMATFFNSDTQALFKSQPSTEIMRAYQLSGMAKVNAVKQYINEILQNNVKILVFAHHQVIMDEIEAQLKNKNRKFIRIDGHVEENKRQDAVVRFQAEGSDIMVALLSITAAGIGLTLTAASTVIFAQLHWTPAWMIQAEDRVHRVGQKMSVNCHYLIGQNTIDDMMYGYLQKKCFKVSSFVDGKQGSLNVQQLKKGEKGKFSKRQEPQKLLTFPKNLLFPVQNENEQITNPNCSQMSQSQISNCSEQSFSVPGSRKRVPRQTQHSLLGFLQKSKISPKQIHPQIQREKLEQKKRNEQTDFSEPQQWNRQKQFQFGFNQICKGYNSEEQRMEDNQREELFLEEKTNEEQSEQQDFQRKKQEKSQTQIFSFKHEKSSEKSSQTLQKKDQVKTNTMNHLRNSEFEDGFGLPVGYEQYLKGKSELSRFDLANKNQSKIKNTLKQSKDFKYDSQRRKAKSTKNIQSENQHQKTPRNKRTQSQSQNNKKEQKNELQWSISVSTQSIAKKQSKRS